MRNLEKIDKNLGLSITSPPVKYRIEKIMYIQEKTEQNIALNSSIVPVNKQSQNSLCVTQKETEAHGAIKNQTKNWAGRVSLDDRQHQNKPQKDDVGRINNAIANGATEIDEDELIKAITSGQSWSPTTFNGKSDREHFVEMSALVTDFDKGFENLDEILKRAEEHNLKFSFVHESFSHTPERPKYRGVILLEHPIKDYKTAKLRCNYIKDVFKGMIDTMAAKPTHFYFGGPIDSLVFHNEGHSMESAEIAPLHAPVVLENTRDSNSWGSEQQKFETDVAFKLLEDLNNSCRKDFNLYIESTSVDSITFLKDLANIDIIPNLQIDINDKSIPANIRFIVMWIQECIKLCDEVNELHPIKGDDSQKRRKYLEGKCKKFDVIQQSFENICQATIKYDISKSRFTFDDDSVVIWSYLASRINKVISARDEPFYDGTVNFSKRNVNTEAVIDALNVHNIYYPQQAYAHNLDKWDHIDRYQKLADSLQLDSKSDEFKVVLTWFKGTMNRWLIPGSKHDNVLVIHGNQGKMKSTFINRLSPAYASAQGTTEKDELLRYHKNNIIEFEEIDGLTRKADVAALKKFFSSTEDDIRPPYGRESIVLKRAYSCCATVNTSDFLKDLTGNRRYIVVSVGNNVIKSDWLLDINERNQFWSQLKEDTNILHYVPLELQAIQAEMSSRFTHIDSDTELIMDYIETLTDDMKSRGYIIDPFDSTRSKTKNPNYVPMTATNLAFAIFGQEAFTSFSSKRLNKVLNGKLKKVMVEKLNFIYKARKYKGKKDITYGLK